MKITFRQEQPMDYRAVENVTREAFWNRFMPGCDEHYLAHIMRGHKTFVPELDIIAVADDKIVGNIMYVKSTLKADDGNAYEVLTLGPISVLPEYQSKGIGGKLIAHSREIAREMGFRAIFLFGDPNYYLQQGFVPAETLGIRTEEDMYFDAFHACPLYEGALAGIRGRYYEDEIYTSLDKAAVAEFDKTFPKKEEVVDTPSQIRFQQIAKLQRKAE